METKDFFLQFQMPQVFSRCFENLLKLMESPILDPLPPLCITLKLTFPMAVGSFVSVEQITSDLGASSLVQFAGGPTRADLFPVYV